MMMMMNDDDDDDDDGDDDDKDDDDDDDDDHINGVFEDTLQNILKFSLPRRTLTSTIRCHK